MLDDVEVYLRQSFATQADGAPRVVDLARVAQRKHQGQRRRRVTSTVGASLTVLLLAGGLTASVASSNAAPSAAVRTSRPCSQG